MSTILLAPVAPSSTSLIQPFLSPQTQTSFPSITSTAISRTITTSLAASATSSKLSSRPSASSEAGLIAAIVCSIVALFVLLILLSICFWRWQESQMMKAPKAMGELESSNMVNFGNREVEMVRNTPGSRALELDGRERYELPEYQSVGYAGGRSWEVGMGR